MSHYERERSTSDDPQTLALLTDGDKLLRRH